MPRILELKSISEIANKQFFVPHYQRGYRWIEQQVLQLLDDLDGFHPREIPKKPKEKTFYCLQPIVVKLLDEDTKTKNRLDGEWYELVDGQQRLTSIFIILQYINQKWVGEDKLPQFKLDYETREGCLNFLRSLKVNSDDTVDISVLNIDYYHISRALQAIRNWQLRYAEEKGQTLNTASFQSTFTSFSKIIWYEVGPEEDTRALFERLNLGKIPLTNAELTKALFLSAESFKDRGHEERQIIQFEIARLWDEIEQKLSETDLKFWSFITNKKRATYETRIELLLDLIVGRQEDERDDFFTFFKFTEKQKSGDLLSVWSEIERFYYTICQWYSDPEYYHKIGYLVTAKHFASYRGINLIDLLHDATIMTKNDFDQKIEKYIADSVKVELSELRYESHYNQLFNVLLLFNVETYRNREDMVEFYPFKLHKDSVWSLEHIHARNSQDLRSKKEYWIKWLDMHEKILNNKLNEGSTELEEQKIVQTLATIIKYKNPQLTWERFSRIFNEVNDLFTDDSAAMDRESEGIRNLALLSQPDNAALNNSVFEIKRREIVRLDKQGSFIPICTRRVFMKYYNDYEVNGQHFYWSVADRDNYFKTLTKTLKVYLPINHVEPQNDENEKFS